MTDPTKPSPHEQLARERKAAKLVAAIDRSAVNQDIDPYDQAGRILAASWGWDDDCWHQIARLAGTKPPSEETRKHVRAAYKARATEGRIAS